MTDQREKRIQEIRKTYADEQKWAGDPEDVRFLLAEISRLQVERDNAIAERDELIYELREAQERASLD